MISEAEKNILDIINHLGIASFEQISTTGVDMSAMSVLLREEMIGSECLFDGTYYLLTPKGLWQLDLWKRMQPNSEK